MGGAVGGRALEAAGPAILKGEDMQTLQWKQHRCSINSRVNCIWFIFL